MNTVKVYVIVNGRRDGSYGATSEIEESIWKIVSTRQKAISLIMSEKGLIPNEDGYVKYNVEEHLINGRRDDDYEYFRIDEHDLEQE